MTTPPDKSWSLLPCPCCGSEAAFDEVQHETDPNFGGEYVECQNKACGVTTRLVFPNKGDVRRELAEVWNRRSHYDAARAADNRRLEREGKPYHYDCAGYERCKDCGAYWHVEHKCGDGRYYPGYMGDINGSGCDPDVP